MKSRLTKREEAAFNDGKNACRAGQPTESCTRRNPEQRAAWLRGYEEQRRWKTAETITPEAVAESKRVLAALKEHVRRL